MSNPSPVGPARYHTEAETSVEIMRNLQPALQLDYSVRSIEALEQFIATHFDPPQQKYVGQSLPIGVGCYVGEVIVRTMGGAWNVAGQPQINYLGAVEAIFPLDKAFKRFANGPSDSLVGYYKTVAYYARQAGNGRRARR